MQLKSIQVKIAFAAGACLLATAATLIIYGLVSSGNTQDFVSKRVGTLLEEQAKQNLGAVAQAQAAAIQSALQDNLDTARTMAKVFEVVRKHMAELSAQHGLTNPARDILNDILLHVLQNNPKYLGAYSAWEPGALDGRDSEFAGDAKHGYDASGRFIPYWNRDDQGKIARQALVDYENPELNTNGVGKGAWYLGSRATGKELVLDPLPYIIQGKQDWLATINAPVKDESGKWLGLAGTDLRLNFLQDLAKQVAKSLYGGKADVRIISNMGLVVASSDDPKEIGGSVKSFAKDGADEVIRHVQQGDAFADINKNGLMRAYAPVQLGRTGKPWSVLIRVPTDVAMADAKALEADLSERAKQAGFWQVGVGLGVTILAIGVLWFTSAGIVRPIRKAADFAEKVAEGDFSQTLDINQRDETGVLAHALRTMVGNLKEMIGRAEAKSREAAAEADRARQAVGEAETARAEAAEAQRRGQLDAAGRIEVVARGLTAVSDELSTQVSQSREGADLQRQHAGETATAMEQMNATVLEVAKNASEAASGSDTAKEKAKDGARVVQQMVTAIGVVKSQAETLKTNMDALGHQAQGIGQIIDVISDIADQTNLLALNAAIEAARAGEAGRGFAVVADEVRKLAEKTMTATGEVDQVVRAIQSGAAANVTGVENAGKAVAQATDLAERSGAVLEEIVAIVESSADQVRSIATASEEQSAASEQINRAVEDINRISSDTAQAMGQAARAVEDLTHQAGELRRLVEALQSA
jgi:methyl-accepting chemotaxis protein